MIFLTHRAKDSLKDYSPPLTSLAKNKKQKVCFERVSLFPSLEGNKKKKKYTPQVPNTVNTCTMKRNPISQLPTSLLPHSCLAHYVALAPVSTSQLQWSVLLASLLLPSQLISPLEFCLPLSEFQGMIFLLFET